MIINVRTVSAFVHYAYLEGSPGGEICGTTMSQVIGDIVFLHISELSIPITVKRLSEFGYFKASTSETIYALGSSERNAVSNLIEAYREKVGVTIKHIIG